MNIEFHSPGTEVKQWVINFIKEKLMDFHHRDKEIARAEICFRTHPGLKDGEKVCEINITAYGNSFFIRRHSDTYESVARRIMEELTEKIEDLVRKQNEPPDEIVTTVRV